MDVPWYEVYTAEPLEGIDDASEQELVLGGEVCMWGETADTSDVQQTIWPRAAAAAGMPAFDIHNLVRLFSLIPIFMCKKKIGILLIVLIS